VLGRLAVEVQWAGMAKKPAAQPSAEDQAQLARFASGPTAAERLETLRGLTSRKPTATITSHPLFLQGVDGLLAQASGGEEEARKEALFALLRQIPHAQALGQRIDDGLRSALAAGFPPVADGDTEDRERWASALGRLKLPWTGPYLASMAAAEPGEASRVRRACVAAMGPAGLGLGWGEAIELLVAALKRQDDPPETLARQVGGLARDLRAERLPRGDGGGVAKLASLFRDRASRAVKLEAWQRAVEELAWMVHEVARSRLSLAVEASTYASLRALRDGRHGDWEATARGSAALAQLREDLTEALLVRAQCGVPDGELFEQLVVASGSRSLAREAARALASTPGLSPPVQAWLRGEEASPRPDGALEALKSEAELPRLAAALRDATALRAGLVRLRQRASSELPLVAPQMLDPLGQHEVQAQALIEQVFMLASARGLRVVGEVGGRTALMPAHHQLTSVPAEGVGTVRWLTTAVEQVQPDGTTRVVLQALVEPLPPPG